MYINSESWDKKKQKQPLKNKILFSDFLKRGDVAR